ncbi:MAG: DUF4282 domain-containing protein [Solirubrobacteraceae bacterium]|nr:DUF4282 domain-containing protein [Solirubrobacteraceae bacterium]
MQKGFFGSLFDLSFSSFVTTKVIKVLYVLSLVLLVLAYIAIAVALFTGGSSSPDYYGDGFYTDSGGSPALGLLWLFVGGPLMLFFYTLFYRVVFELIIVVFRIFENTRDQLELMRAAQPAAGGPPLAPPSGPPVPLPPPAPAGPAAASEDPTRIVISPADLGGDDVR